MAARYSLRWSCCDWSSIGLGVIGPFGHAPSRTSSLSTVEVEALPSHRVVLSQWSAVLWPPPTSQTASLWTSPRGLIPAITVDVGHRPPEISPVPSFAVTASRSPYAGGFFAAASPGSSPLPWPSLAMKARLPLAPPQGLTYRRCKIHVMLRATVLHPVRRGLHRFRTSGRPEARDACYMASWQLPRLDLHQQADDDLAGHTIAGLCARL